MFGGFSAGETDPRLPVAYLDQDGGEVATQFLQMLEVSSVIRPVFEVDQEVEKQVADEELAAAVIIPPGFSAGVVENQPIRITVIVDSTTTAGMTALGEIQSVTNRLQTAVQTAQISTQTYQVERTFQDDASQQIYFADTWSERSQLGKSPRSRSRQLKPGLIRRERIRSRMHLLIPRRV